MARKVASAVHPFLTRTERVGYKLFRRQLRAIQISACKPVAANVQLSCNSNRHRLSLPVQNVAFGVRHRTTDQDRLLPDLSRGTRLTNIVVSVGP